MLHDFRNNITLSCVNIKTTSQYFQWCLPTKDPITGQHLFPNAAAAIAMYGSEFTVAICASKLKSHSLNHSFDKISHRFTHCTVYIDNFDW